MENKYIARLACSLTAVFIGLPSSVLAAKYSAEKCEEKLRESWNASAHLSMKVWKGRCQDKPGLSPDGKVYIGYILNAQGLKSEGDRFLNEAMRDPKLKAQTKADVARFINERDMATCRDSLSQATYALDSRLRAQYHPSSYIGTLYNDCADKRNRDRLTDCENETIQKIAEIKKDIRNRSQYKAAFIDEMNTIYANLDPFCQAQFPNPAQSPDYTNYQSEESQALSDLREQQNEAMQAIQASYAVIEEREAAQAREEQAKQERQQARDEQFRRETINAFTTATNEFSKNLNAELQRQRDDDRDRAAAQQRIDREQKEFKDRIATEAQERQAQNEHLAEQRAADQKKAQERQEQAQREKDRLAEAQAVERNQNDNRANAQQYCSVLTQLRSGQCKAKPYMMGEWDVYCPGSSSPNTLEATNLSDIRIDYVVQWSCGNKQGKESTYGKPDEKVHALISMYCEKGTTAQAQISAVKACAYANIAHQKVCYP